MPRNLSPIAERQKAVLVGSLLIVAAMGAIAAVTSRAVDWRPVALVLVLAGFSVASEVLAVLRQRPKENEMDWVITSTAPLVLAMTLLGPAPAAAIAAIGLAVSDLFGRAKPMAWTTNQAQFALFTVSGSLFCRWIAESTGLTPDEPAFALLFVGVYAYASGTSFLLNALTGVIAYGDSLSDQFRRERGWVGADAVTALLATATAYAYGTVGLEALGLLVIVQLVYQYLARNLSISEDRADALNEQASQLSELSASRGRLVGQVLHAEETERRRLAETLHDDVLQNLLAARHSLATGTNGGFDIALAAIDETIDQLHDEIFDLHPALLEEAGLAAGLRAVADHQAERGAFRADVSIASEARGPYDRLLFVLGREQLTNAAKHSKASEVSLVVARNEDKLVMDVTDNGCGMGPDHRRAALEQGHIGLASSAERVEALGGKLEIDTAPGRGTRIRTTLPLLPSDSSDPHLAEPFGPALPGAGLPTDAVG